MPQRSVQPDGGSAQHLDTAPLNKSREVRVEIVAITASEKRQVNVGNADHTRYYGLDLAGCLCGAGFARKTFRMTPEKKVWNGLPRDLWLCTSSGKLLPPVAGGAGVWESRT